MIIFQLANTHPAMQCHQPAKKCYDEWRTKKEKKEEESKCWMKKKSQYDRWKHARLCVCSWMWLSRLMNAYTTISSMNVCVCACGEQAGKCYWQWQWVARVKVVKEEIRWHFFLFHSSFSFTLLLAIHTFHCWFGDRSRWNINQSIEDDRNSMWYTLYHKASNEQHLNFYRARFFLKC